MFELAPEEQEGGYDVRQRGAVRLLVLDNSFATVSRAAGTDGDCY